MGEPARDPWNLDNLELSTDAPPVMDEEEAQTQETDPYDVTDLELDRDGVAPEATPPPIEPMAWGDVAKSAAKNLLPSAWQNVVDTVSIVKPENAKMLGQLAAELGISVADVSSAPKITKIGQFLLTPNPQALGELIKEMGKERVGDAETPLLDAVIDFYKSNYGFGPDGIEGFKRFLAEDPAGFVFDVLAVASLGAGTAAKGAKLASAVARGTRYAARFEKYAKAATKIDEVVNKGFAITPDADSRVVKGIYKITDAPVVGPVARKAWDVSEDATTGARRVGVGASELADPGALIAGGAVRSVARTITRGEHPNLRTDMVERAEAEDVPLIASAKTGDKSIATGEGRAVEGGNQEMIRMVDEMNAGIESFGQRIADDISDVNDAMVAGTRLGDGITAYTDEFIKEKNRLYARWADEAAEVDAVDQPLREVLQQIQQESVNPYGARAIPPDIAELIENIEAGKTGKYLDLKQKRTEIREKMKGRTDPIVNQNMRWYSMVTHGLTKSMDETITRNAPHLQPLIEEADRFYAQGLDKINSEWGKRIFKATGGLKEWLRKGLEDGDLDLSGVPDVNPDGLMRMIFQPSTSTSQIPLIYELVGGFDSEAGRAMRAYFVRRLIEKARKTADIEAGDVAWTGPALAREIKNIDKISPGRLDAFLGKESADKVRLFSEIVTATGGFQRKGQGSRTAPLLMASVGLSTLADDIGRMILHGQSIEPLPIVLAGGLGIAAWVGKAEWDRWLNSRTGQDWQVYGISRNAAGQFLSQINHLKHSATWHKLYMLANRPLREMMREAEQE